MTCCPLSAEDDSVHIFFETSGLGFVWTGRSKSKARVLNH